MKPFRWAAFLFYNYYSKGNQAGSDPYFRTICTLTILIFLHLMQLLIIFEKVDLIPISPSDGQGMRRLIFFLILFPIFLVTKQLIPKERIEAMKEENAYQWEKIFTWNIWLIIYIIVSVLFFIFLAWKSRWRDTETWHQKLLQRAIFYEGLNYTSPDISVPSKYDVESSMRSTITNAN